MISKNIFSTLLLVECVVVGRSTYVDSDCTKTCELDNPCKPGITQFYFEHCKRRNYIQCDAHGGCFERRCPKGTRWNQDFLTCVHKTCGECNNNCRAKDVAKGKLYRKHCNDNTKFIQCDKFGGCFEMDCAPGTVWKSDGSCSPPNQDDEPTDDSHTDNETKDDEPIEYESRGSFGVLTLAGLTTNGFNPLSGQLQFNINNETFSLDRDDVMILVNGFMIPDSSIDITPQTITADYYLEDGINSLSFITLDSKGLMLSFETSVIAGDGTLTVNVVDESASPVSGAAVTIQLSDDAALKIEETSDANGIATFGNIPTRTLIVTAVDASGIFGTTSSIGGSTVNLTVLGFNTPSTVENNDFSQGTEGWDIANAAAVTTYNHLESTAGGRRLQNDIDLIVGTGGKEGPSSISRTFTAKPNVKTVSVRYKFITSEVPGGFFMSPFNDYFSISLRSQAAASQVSENNLMNGLGLNAFDFSSGSTAWREVELPVTVDGDVIQLDVTVANVGDGLYDSFVVIDKIEEKYFAITSMSLFDIDNSPLNYLSAAAHTYFGGNTRIHGTITIQGEEDDGVESLVLEVLQGGSVVATADLSATAEGSLIQTFGSDKKVEVSQAQLLFELPSAMAAQINGDTDGTVTLRAKATSTTGEEATRTYATSPQILIRHTNNDRYGPRDGIEGGDDWVKPSVNPVISHFDITVNDFSNMNGGRFPPHGSHQTGNDVDGKYDGYANRDAAAAATMLGYLNDATYGSRIELVFVTFSRTNQDTFWVAIRNEILTDGRRARDVIRVAGDHTTHFHWRVQ